jgi:hypothetical protein
MKIKCYVEFRKWGLDYECMNESYTFRTPYIAIERDYDVCSCHNFKGWWIWIDFALIVFKIRIWK